MIRKIKVYFTASNDSDFEPGEEEVFLLAPDITVTIDGNEWVFRFPSKPVADDQEITEIDISTCGRVEMYMENVDLEFLSKASFLDVVRASKR